MTNEMKAWLDEIEPVDTTPTRQWFETVKQEARNEYQKEIELITNQGTVCSPYPKGELL
jgi:hypothetical protein